jgi:peptidoglycan/LPS O-acetylase OafA/YrhL
MKPVYQPELDGLRALAVTLVVLFHAGAAWIPAGYVGVDVFFVLSGFLITRNLAFELQSTGKIRFRTFYMRRVRRLFPAMISTIIFSFLGAFLLFSPQQLIDFFASAASATISIANVYFWFEADYFDALATTKPLLHTWSLSVEEQFYLVWPIAMYGLWRLLNRRGTFVALAGISVASLLLSQGLLKNHPSFAFYLLPSRVFELGMGAMLVFLPDLRGRVLREGSAALGLIMIVSSAVFYTEQTPFPGLPALLPVGGTALFIAGSRAPVIGGLFRFAPAVWLGRISYSVYLVHWPIVVFLISYSYAPLAGGAQIAGLFGLSVLLGWLQFRFVEQRFRYPQASNRTFIRGAILAAVSVIAFSFTFGLGNGMAWRLPESRISQSQTELRDLQWENYCTFPKEGLNADLITCQNYRGKDRSIYIWGDSHALHLAPGFAEAYPDYNIYVLYQSGCTPQSGFAGYVRNFKSSETRTCIGRNKKALEFFQQLPPTNVIITSAKRSRPALIARSSKGILEQLKAAGHNAILLGDFIRPGVHLIDCISVPGFLISDKAIKTRCVGDPATAAKELQYNRSLAKLMPEMVVPNDIQCPDGSCRYFKDGAVLYRDTHHLSLLGSTEFIGQLKPSIPINPALPDQP